MKNQEMLLNKITPFKENNELYIKEIDARENFMMIPIIKKIVKNTILEKVNKPYTEAIITRSIKRDRIEIW